MDKLFKGYIPSDGKIPKKGQVIKGRSEFYALEDVAHLRDYAGILRDDIIMIDSDDSEESEILYKICRDKQLSCDIQKTTRGMHFYFFNSDVKTNCTAKLCAIGLTLDIKLGSKNLVVPLKINGEEREWLKITLKGEGMDILPKWLKPIKNAISFKNMKDGDGRNSKLYSYILTLQCQGFKTNEIREIIDIINSYLFKDPLSKQEIETILRNESFQKPAFFIDDKFQYHVFSQYMLQEHKIYKIGGPMHTYDNGVYVWSEANTQIIKKMYEEIPSIRPKDISDTLFYMTHHAVNSQVCDARYILFNNCILDIRTMEKLSHNPDFVFQNKINFDYDEFAYDSIMDRTLDKLCCHNTELRQLLEEITGYCMYRRNEMRKMFIFTGEANSGKSTFLDVLGEMIGYENRESLSLKDLNTTFKPAKLLGKLVNLGDDISNQTITDSENFKKLASGGETNIESKFKTSFSFKNYAKLIFSCNTMPRILDTTTGVTSRLVQLPFNAVFTKNDPDYDPEIIDKLTKKEAIQYLIALGISAFRKALERKSFIIPKCVQDLNQEFEIFNNDVVRFVHEVMPIQEIDGKLTDDVFLAYETWLRSEGHNCRNLKKTSLSQGLKERFHIITQVKNIDGKTRRIYSVIM